MNEIAVLQPVTFFRNGFNEVPSYDQVEQKDIDSIAL